MRLWLGLLAALVLTACGGCDEKGTESARGPDPIPVGNCTNLGAVGVWEKISPPEVADYHATGVLLDPKHPGVAYTGAFIDVPGFTGAGLWKTEDCGSTWERLAQGQRIDTHAPILMAIDPTDTRILYAIGFLETAFKSIDGGREWTAISPDLPGPNGKVGWVQWIGMDPGDARHLAATMHDNCSGSIGPMCMAESFDGGTTWRGFRGPAEFGGWVEGAGVQVISRTEMLLSADLGVFYTGDAGANWEKVIASSCGPNMVSGSDGDRYLGCKDGIYKSADGARHWTHVAGTPWADKLIEAEGAWYAAATNDYSGAPYHTAPAGDMSKWKTVETPKLKQGCDGMAYDSANGLLYASSASAGLWRVRLK